MTLIIFLPMLFAAFIWLLPNKQWIRSTALGFSLVEFILSLFILNRFDPSRPELQLVEQVSWIDSVGISYFVGIDGISLWLVLLTTFLTPLTILGSWSAIAEKVRGFHVCLFVLQTTVLGTFLAMDAILFILFLRFSGSHVFSDWYLGWF